MNKYFVLTLLCFLSFGIKAEQKMARDTSNLLPVKGDIGLGFDAMPFLSYFGTFGNGAGATPFFAGYGNGLNALWGKYYIENNKAIRVMLRPGFGSIKTTNPVASSADVNVDVIDEKKVSSKNIVIGVGYELRRGKRRVQGYYGGDILISIGSWRESYNYGNNFADTMPIVLFTDDFNIGSTLSAATRLKEYESGNTIGLSLKGFIGVEYFFAPKISVAAEYGWGFGLMQSGESKTVMEFLQNTSTVTSTTTTGQVTEIVVDTDVSGAVIRVMFHF